MTDGANWSAGIPTAASTAIFDSTGINHSPVMNSDFNTKFLWFDEDVATPTSYSITGSGKIIIATGGYISSGSRANQTIDVAQITLNRNSGFYAGDYFTSAPNAGTGTLTIGSSVGGAMLVNIIGASTSNNFTVAANNYNGDTPSTLIVYPKLDFSGVTSSTTSNSIRSYAYSGTVVKLLGGITGGATPGNGNPSKYFHTEGGAGGVTILGDSTGWLGRAQVNISDLEINSNNSLGVVGSASSGYTEIVSGAGTSALLLNKGSGSNINSGEYIFIYGRTAATSPQIKNISGDNILSGTINSEAASGYAVISSDGTGAGNSLTISGSIIRSAATNGTLVLQGDGDGTVSGTISQPSTGVWDVAKNGAGTWTFTNANTYTGPTTVQAGTLKLTGTGSIANSASVEVKSGAFFDVASLTAGQYVVPATQTLMGVGTVVGAVQTTSGSAIAPGGSVVGSTIGTLNINGDLSLVNGSVMNYELTNNPAAANDKTNITGNLLLSGTTTINVTQTDLSLGVGSYRLIDYTGTLTGGVGNINIPGITGGLTRTPIALQTSVAHQINLVVSAGGGAQTYTWGSAGSDYNWTIGNTGANDWTSTDQKFFNADTVSFDDTGKNGSSIALNGALQPASLAFNNNAGHDYSFNGSGSIGSVASPVPLSLNGSGTVTFANSAANHFSSVAITGGVLAFNQSVDATVSGLSGGGDLHQNGSGVLTVSGDGSLYDGTVYVNAGTLRVGSSTALGSSYYWLNVAPGATLDIDSNSVPLRTVHVSGTGVGGLGAIVNSNVAAAPTGDSFTNVTLDGDTTISATLAGNWWSTTTLDAQGYGLTKIGDYEVDIASGETHLGNINILGGSLYFFGNATLGDATLGDAPGDVHIGNDGVLAFAFYTGTSPHVTKPITVDATGGSLFDYGQAANTGLQVDSTIQLDGNLTVTERAFVTTTNISLNGQISGPGNLTVANNLRTNVYLLANNDYTGTTTIDAGAMLQLGLGAADGSTGGTTGSIVTSNSLTNNGTLQISRSGAHRLADLAPTVAGGGTLQFFADDGIITVDTDNTYTGNTRVNYGTVILKKSQGFGVPAPGSIIYIRNNFGAAANQYGVLQLDGSAGNLTIAEDFQFTGGGGANSTPDGIIQNIAGNNKITGNMTVIGGAGSARINVMGGTLELTGTITNNNTPRMLEVTGTNTLTISGAMHNGAGTSTLGLNVFGPNTTILTNGDNTYSYDTNIYGGKLELTSAGQMPNTAIYNHATYQIDGGTHSLQAVLNGGDGTGGMYVLSDSDVTTPSIEQDTLQIGGVAPSAAAASAVPEPSTLLLLLIGSGAFAMFLRRKAA